MSLDMLHTLLDESLHKAKHAFKEARSENIIDVCEKYLILLNEFRTELNKFRGTPEISLQQKDSLLFKETLQKRQEIHLAITHTIQELNQTQALLNWLTAPSGYEAAETFNRLKYQGLDCWEFRGAKIGFSHCPKADEIAVQEAVSIAVGLRCQEFISPSVFNQG